MVIKRSELYAFSLGILIHIFYFRSLYLIFIHLLGLYSSLILYRLLFHPLRRFPGPFLSRISAFWISAQLHRRPLFRKLADLHETYGSFVRIGPSDLSIVHPKATNIIYGFKSTCTKSAWYDGSAPLKSLHAHRIRADHDKHRRIWNPGFTDRALHGYEKRIQVYRQKLINQITSADDDEPVNISTLFTWYGYDVMGDLAFGQSFDMLEKSSTHWAVLLILSMLKPVEYLMPIWFFRLSVSIPFASKAFWKFNEYWGQLFRTRMATKQEIPDISACLLEPLKGRTPTTDEFNGLLGDASLIINAGGDTTATTLTTIVYELARRPLEVQKLRAELAVCTTDANGEYAHENLTTLKQLNGVINETLRIHSPVPSYIPRKTPPEGIDIEGTHVPGNMNVFCPQWIISQSETVYQNAQDFIPERWYLYPEMIKERSAYAPFTTGPYTCIGKPLALMNIRATIARLVTAFNMELAPGDDGRALERSMREHFSIYMADDIRVIFRKCAI
ncbi:cytochrome P450 monooxygenase ftmC [Aspergillus alliaceus]|uniref:cytochrome P450 monooxygenase ftmC n=1 Tax=Petromyces alliaceus TaxID=209559 RepID=UPI0012A3B6E7|nr:cytochrome P450 [Aspergillus alliaceus]KAB8234093.1 cytochrome P450 [Aspergillus alliaceus]